MTSLPNSVHHFLAAAWDWDLSKIIGCIFLAVVYALWIHFGPTRLSIKTRLIHCILYLAGVKILFLSLASPLDALSDEYLFSAHMLQHFLLLMIVPPLMILGLPPQRTRELLRHRWFDRTERVLNRPWEAWVAANLILWIWHIPALYNLVIENEALHIFQHLTFLVSATIFWWPVLAPVPERRMEFSSAMIYLVTAALSNMLLGIVLTFASQPVYLAYLNPEDTWGILSYLRGELHLDPLSDQMLGGVLMWVLGSVVFLAVILEQCARWYRSKSIEQMTISTDGLTPDLETK